MDVLMEEQQEWQVIRKQIEEKETILKDELLVTSFFKGNEAVSSVSSRL